MPTKQQERKRISGAETANNQVDRALSTVMTTPTSPEVHPVSGMPPPRFPGGLSEHLGRMLNLLAEQNMVLGYGLLLTQWLESQGITVPGSLFKLNPFAAGARGRVNTQKLDFGHQAFFLQWAKISGTEAQFSLEALKVAIAQPASRYASAIAKDLRKKQYERNRDRAVTYVKEAIRNSQKYWAKYLAEQTKQAVGQKRWALLLHGTPSFD